MCYIVCDKCGSGSPGEHSKREAVWTARECGWKTIKGEIVCGKCQEKTLEETSAKDQLKLRKRINHRKLHRGLEADGYSVYVLDYANGAHYYQIEKQEPYEWHEYGVKTTKDGKYVELSGVGKELYERIAE